MMGINHPNTKTQKPITWSIVPKTFSKEIFYKGKGIFNYDLEKKSSLGMITTCQTLNF
jgi:hypothetical protein